MKPLIFGCASAVIISLCSFLAATEVKPWQGNVYEFELRSNVAYQGFTSLQEGGHLKKYHGNDFFLNLSLLNGLPDPSCSLELEATEAWTRKQKGSIDQLKLTGRYFIRDDVAGDPFSLTVGLSYIQAFKWSLRDVSSFHHGFYNTELFLSFGKESADSLLWESRWWGVFAVGMAERGSPWIAFRLDYEKRWGENHQGAVFADTLWGLGREKLRLNHFMGYGPIRHQSVDLGLRYTYDIDYFGSASIQYSYRVFANNFPAHTHQVLAQILYTFGL